MATVAKSTTVRATPGEVWAVLADFDAISSWAANVDHSCLLTDQTEGVGTVRRIQSGRITVVETVEAWEPGATLRYAITGLPPVVRSVTNEWSLEEATTGTAGGGTQVASTTITLTTDVDAGPRPPQQGIAKIVARKLGQASDQMLAGLTERLETPTTTAAVQNQETDA